MGLSISSLFNAFSFAKREVRIVMLGLDAAGKTSECLLNVIV